MWWLWLVVASLIVLLVWHKREGYTDDNPNTMSMKHQGHLIRINEIFKKYLDGTGEDALNQKNVDIIKKQADQNDEDLFKLQENMAMKPDLKRKDAYPDPADVDMKAV
jgi:hypothetical protein